MNERSLNIFAKQVATVHWGQNMCSFSLPNLLKLFTIVFYILKQNNSSCSLTS